MEHGRPSGTHLSKADGRHPRRCAALQRPRDQELRDKRRAGHDAQHQRVVRARPHSRLGEAKGQRPRSQHDRARVERLRGRREGAVSDRSSCHSLSQAAQGTAGRPSRGKRPRAEQEGWRLFTIATTAAGSADPSLRMISMLTQPIAADAKPRAEPRARMCGGMPQAVWLAPKRNGGWLWE